MGTPNVMYYTCINYRTSYRPNYLYTVLIGYIIQERSVYNHNILPIEGITKNYWAAYHKYYVLELGKL